MVGVVSSKGCEGQRGMAGILSCKCERRGKRTARTVSKGSTILVLAVLPVRTQRRTHTHTHTQMLNRNNLTYPLHLVAANNVVFLKTANQMWPVQNISHIFPPLVHFYHINNRAMQQEQRWSCRESNMYDYFFPWIMYFNGA